MKRELKVDHHHCVAGHVRRVTAAFPMKRELKGAIVAQQYYLAA